MKYADLDEARCLDDLLTQITRLSEHGEACNVDVKLEGNGTTSECICDDVFLAAFNRFLGQQKKAVAARLAKLGVLGA